MASAGTAIGGCTENISLCVEEQTVGVISVVRIAAEAVDRQEFPTLRLIDKLKYCSALVLATKFCNAENISVAVDGELEWRPSVVFTGETVEDFFSPLS